MCVFIYYCFYTTYICKLFFANRPASLIPLHFHFLSLLKRLLPLPIKHSLKKKTKLRKNLKSNQQEEEKKKQLFQFLAAMMFIQVTIHIASCYTIEFIIMIHHL